MAGSDQIGVKNVNGLRGVKGFSRFLGRVLAKSSIPCRVVAATLLGAGLAVVCVGPQAASASQVHITTMKLTSPLYKPHGGPGVTDDYHCTLLNPHIAHDSYIISNRFIPGSPEDHHAGLFLVPPSMVAETEQANVGGKGWTCFGEASLPNEPLSDFGKTPFVTVWAPGHGIDELPRGTGIRIPAGSLFIMQVHYNLLVGDKPVRNSIIVQTVPASAPLVPLSVDLSFGAPDIPCPAGVTGPLCTRTASLANQVQRFGPMAGLTVDGIEALCGRNPTDPPAGDTTTCTSGVASSGYIVRVQAHMHLLGRSFQLTLNPNTAESKTVLNVPNYNFHYQKAYNLATPIPVQAGEPYRVTCSYDPTLAQELPILRRAPSHFVTWGDGSSDEMCLGLTWIAPRMPDAHSSI